MMSRMSHFPPRPDHEHEFAALLNMLRSVLGEQRADYVSAPLTGGPRFVDWFSTRGMQLTRGSDAYKREHKEHVVDPNATDALAFTARLRAMGNLVIEPTRLDIAHWTQNDYRYLWGMVVQRYTARIFFIDGWEYSYGCAYEFWIGVTSGIVCCAQTGEPFSLRDGITRISEAVRALEKIDRSQNFMRAVLHALKQEADLTVAGS